MMQHSSDPPFPGYRPGAVLSAREVEKSGAMEDMRLPFLAFENAAMELFDPAKHLARMGVRSHEAHSGPSGATSPLPLYLAARANPSLILIPRREDCLALWDRYAMLDNIRAHSLLVADMAFAIARQAGTAGVPCSPEVVFAAGLLHDLGKTYTIAHGGNHAQLGAAWTLHETRNAEIARCVLYHVHWPWEDHFYTVDFFSIMAIEYADKRVRHDSYVSLDERFEDLLDRYGKNQYARERIAMSHHQGKRVERVLSDLLGVQLHEYTADSGRLVK